MVSTINFPYYSSSNRVPGTWIDIDSSRANTSEFNQPSLVIGQMLASGTATPNIPVLVGAFPQALTQFGSRSMIYQMIEAYRVADSFGELWALPLLDNPAGTAASNTVTFTGAPTVPGTLNVYVNGTNVQAQVAVGDTPTLLAAKLVAALVNYPDVAVTAVAALGVVTFTALHAGIAAGDLTVNLNYRGASNGETTPAGLTVAVGTATNGTADPDLTIGLSNLGVSPFDFIALPYTGTANVALVKNFLSEASGRWSWSEELFGIAFNSTKGNFATTTTFGLAQTDKHITTLGMLNSPTPCWISASVYTAVCAQSLRADPGLPLTQLPLTGVLAPTVDQIPTQSERNTFYYSGISSFVVAADGTVVLERAVTNNQKNLAGIIDNSWLDVETDACLTYICRILKTRLATKFARKKLANNGTVVAAGSNVVTPSMVLNDATAIYRTLETQGLVQETASFIRAARAENAGNGQVNLYLPIILINQLRIVAISLQFTKP